MGDSLDLHTKNDIMTAAAARKAKKAAAKPKAPAAHPPYASMIKAAIKALGDKKGSSRQAILKYICANYKVDAAKAGQHLRMAQGRHQEGNTEDGQGERQGSRLLQAGEG